MGGDAKKEKVPVKEVEKGLKQVCAGVEKDLKAKKVPPKAAKAMREAVEKASKKVSKAVKAAADKDKKIDPKDLDKAMKKESKFKFEIKVEKEEANLFKPEKIKFKPTVKYKVSKDVTIFMSPATVEYQAGKTKALFAPQGGIQIRF